MAPKPIQPFILPRSIKWVPGISGNLVVKSKLLPRSCFGITNNKGCMKLGVRGMNKISKMKSFGQISEILNSHKKRLNWVVKLIFSGNVSLIERNKWQKFGEDFRTSIPPVWWIWLEYCRKSSFHKTQIFYPKCMRYWMFFGSHSPPWLELRVSVKHTAH